MGSGFKTFATNTVLTAADVQGYLQDQSVMSFATSTVRGTAIASPVEGMTTYQRDSNMLETYSGSAWQRQSGGLVPVKPTSVDAASGSGSYTETGIVTFTNVGTRLSLNGVFTSEYKNYRVLLNTGAGNTDNVQIALRYRASGTDVATGYYYGGMRVNAIGGASSVWTEGNVTAIQLGYDRNLSQNQGFTVLDFGAPKVTGQSTVTYQSITYSGSAFYMLQASGLETSNVSYDGFSIIYGSGTHSGTVQVFGYKDN